MRLKLESDQGDIIFKSDIISDDKVQGEYTDLTKELK